MKVTILGAAKNVTGSRFLLETSRSRVLVDCGLYQEREFLSRNWEKFPVSPSSIEKVLLTHAHIDHCGYLPKLVREGFSGDIICTGPTADIAKIALLDSAHLQEHDAEFKKKRHKGEGRKGPYPEVPLYTVYDVENTLPLFKPLKYNQPVQVAPDIEAVYHDAGHILGASMIELSVRENGIRKQCIFSGDIGRWGRPILCDPTFFDFADCVFVESTYGNREHETKSVSLEKLEKVINETRITGGKVIIPTFAIERAQELLYHLATLTRDGRIPPVPVFLDSPMAMNILKVFKNYTSYFDEEAKKLISEGEKLFDLPRLQPSGSVEESKAINTVKGPAIIMAGSGMCTGGRIKHHLFNTISRPENMVLFVGYQAHGTLGRQILERPAEVRIHGQILPVRARIEKINGFSAHADRNELLRWISGFKEPPDTIFVVHGEEESAVAFGDLLKKTFKSNTVVPDYLQEYSL